MRNDADDEIAEHDSVHHFELNAIEAIEDELPRDPTTERRAP
jgi:hypothetical protein